jgi:hypothetical protein
VFDATKNKYRDIQFTQYDYDDSGSAALKEKYGVRGIPHMVFLDSSGKILYSDSGAPRDQGAFENMIQQFR